MRNPSSQYLRAFRAVEVACVFLIFNSVPSSCDSSIDEELIKGDANLNAYDAFHVTRNLTVDFKTDLDILFPIKTFKEMYAESLAPVERRNIIGKENMHWANATIPYEIEKEIIDLAGVIKDAISHWETYTCIKFVESKLAPDRVKFSPGSGCSSYVGSLNRVQEIYLQAGCASERVVIHEIGHTVGFFHEHSRPDRDSYLKVKKTTYGESFRKYTGGVSSYGVPYDYLSIMHYQSADIITTVDPNYQNRIGKSPGLSFGDIKQANAMYNCAQLKANCPEKACPFNGFMLSKTVKGNSACECVCDSGDQVDPLVACSTIKREASGPNLAGASSLTPDDPNTCFNLRPDCESMKNKGMCLMESTKMMEQCTKTCEFCGKGTQLCMDHDTACNLMAASCTDEMLKPIMSKLCRKTCKVCTKLTTPCDIQQALSELESRAAFSQATPMNMFLLLQLVVTFGL